MKHLIFMVVLMLCTVCAKAEIQFRSLDNNGATHIVLVDNNAPKNVQVTDAVLHSNGKEYPAKLIRCDVSKEGLVVYKLAFKRLTFFKDCKITLKVNGVKNVINIQRNLCNM